MVKPYSRGRSSWGSSVKVRLNNQKRIGAIARVEALLAGAILTVSTAYAATVCPMYWNQLHLEAQLRQQITVAQSTSPASVQPGLLGSANTATWSQAAN